jgi:hypothetical protein
MKPDRGLPDFAPVPRRVGTLVGQCYTGGMQLALPKIEIERGNLHLRPQRLPDVVGQTGFQPFDPEPDPGSARPGNHHQGKNDP